MRFTVLHSYKLTRFSNQYIVKRICALVLHSYKLTRFSNETHLYLSMVIVLHSYKLTRFSNRLCVNTLQIEFYTLTNLQGSQTSLRQYTPSFGFTLLQTYKVLKPQMRLSPNPNILVICVRYLVMYKTQIFIYQLIIFTFQTFTLVCLN